MLGFSPVAMLTVALGAENETSTHGALLIRKRKTVSVISNCTQRLNMGYCFDQRALHVRQTNIGVLDVGEHYLVKVLKVLHTPGLRWRSIL